VSIGVSIYPDDAPDAAALQQRADAAMYLAKDAGKNQVRFHLRAGLPHPVHDAGASPEDAPGGALR